ncbi:MAG: molybdopterin synthase sulfur carrier subunit [Cyanobacteria bacterium PR.3.49]|jgi:molybdopterin converting factor subunit 1|nr:molybdopterin synthase sulfur carrier subunit [Cyanobacteria bacterium PR.3.49]
MEALAHLAAAESKTVRVDYFALLKEQRGLASENLETRSSTVLELYEELQKRHGFSLKHSSVAVALNDEFADWSEKLTERDKVVFIPPVAGG